MNGTSSHRKYFEPFRAGVWTLDAAQHLWCSDEAAAALGLGATPATWDAFCAAFEAEDAARLVESVRLAHTRGTAVDLCCRLVCGPPAVP